MPLIYQQQNTVQLAILLLLGFFKLFSIRHSRGRRRSQEEKPRWKGAMRRSHEEQEQQQQEGEKEQEGEEEQEEEQQEEEEEQEEEGKSQGRRSKSRGGEKAIAYVE